MYRYDLTVDDEFEGARIDSFLAEQIEDLSRNRVQNLITSGNLLLNNKSVKASCRLKEGDVICLTVPDNRLPEILPEDIPLEIEYEDSDLIVVNKPKGMVVHPAAGHYSGTLVNALLFHCSDLSGINGVLRPGIVHRIDKDTSGLLVCAKNDFAHSFLASQLRSHSMTRRYEAVAAGVFKEQAGTISGTIGRDPSNRKLMAVNVKNGREFVTHYTVIRQFRAQAYIECVLETGRTHQIRVSMKSIGHPLIGDEVYGGRLSRFRLRGEEICGQCLHAKVLGFVHPRTNEYMEFSCEPPQYFKDLLDVLKNN